MKLGDSLVNMAIEKKLINPSRKQAYDELRRSNIERSNMRDNSESSESNLGKVFDDASYYSGQSKMTNPSNSKIAYNNNRMTAHMTVYEETKKQNNLHQSMRESGAYEPINNGFGDYKKKRKFSNGPGLMARPEGLELPVQSEHLFSADSNVSLNEDQEQS